jgi:glycosyltransferase involved in cell wall biosynthesis
LESIPGGNASRLKGSVFPGRVGLQQRVLPAYRVPFYDALAAACAGGLSVFAGQPQSDEGIATANNLQVARFVQARNWDPLNTSSPWYVLWQPGLLTWLKQWEPRALILEANSRYLSNRLAVAWMHRRGRPVVGWGLGVPQPDKSPGGAGVLAGVQARERLGYYRSLDGIIAYSQRGADEYRALGIPAGRIFIAFNAVAPPPQSPPPTRSSTFNGQPVVLFVGRLQTRKRVDNLLNACAALPPGLQPRLVVVGDGPRREELQALAEKVYPAAQFYGAQHGAALEANFATADLFVLPGTGGLAVQQAMSFGLPVIVAEGDGTQDDLVRPGNGWRVRPGDQDDLIVTLHSALSDPAQLRRKGAESYRIVAEEANLDRMVKVFIQALNEVTLR